jgi:NADPH:quinone reductase-like Zn-dependent oxidoreductase
LRAIKISSYRNAGILKLIETESKPMPSAGQALAGIHKAGVNFIDIYQGQGTYHR